MAILNRFSAILLYCDSTHFFASRCGISGDSRPALGKTVCRTKLPRKALISKRKMVPKTTRNFPEKFKALFCCVESLTGTILKYFTANSRTKSNIFSRRESAGMATLTRDSGNRAVRDSRFCAAKLSRARFWQPGCFLLGEVAKTHSTHYYSSERGS